MANGRFGGSSTDAGEEMRGAMKSASPKEAPARFGRSIGSGEVGGAIIIALLSGLLATGLGWFAAGLL